VRGGRGKKEGKCRGKKGAEEITARGPRRPASAHLLPADPPSRRAPNEGRGEGKEKLLLALKDRKSTRSLFLVDFLPRGDATPRTDDTVHVKKERKKGETRGRNNQEHKDPIGRLLAYQTTLACNQSGGRSKGLKREEKKKGRKKNDALGQGRLRDHWPDRGHFLLSVYHSVCGGRGRNPGSGS